MYKSSQGYWDSIHYLNIAWRTMYYYVPDYSDLSNVLLVLNDYINDLQGVQIDQRTNTFVSHGKEVNINELSFVDVLDLAKTTDNLHGYYNTAFAHRMYHYSVPTVKMHYPEPFIASPSVIHDDIFFIHILQFQYWLWFVFITLIAFFFITFTCVVRWCNVRTRPRRETRGVSRSKCGDFITATVPLTWAGAIIVSESTDPIDYYDGFGAAEMVVGIRAYQWGWEYYYPQNLDINYGVKSNYSTFTGNSLMYTTASSKTLDSNALWKFYQNGRTDNVVTPAYLLVLPTDNAKILNHLNFSEIGTNTLKDSQAFRKIRQSSKTFTSNLVLTPTTLTSKYNTLADLYLKDNNLTGTLNYGNRRQHNLTSTLMSANINRVALDTKSSNNLLTHNFSTQHGLRTDSNTVTGFIGNYNNTQPSPTHLTNTLNLINSDVKTPNYLSKLLNYNDLTSLLNNNTDKQVLTQPLRKLTNVKTLKTANLTLPSELSSFTISNTTNPLNTSSTTSTKLLTTNSDLAKEPTNTQVVRSAGNVNPSTSKLNYSLSLNPYNHLLDNNKSVFNTSFYTDTQTQDVDRDVSGRVLSNRFSVNFVTSPSLSNNPLLQPLNFDSQTSRKITTTFKDNRVTTNLTTNGSQHSYIISGNDLTALDALRQSYWSMHWGQTNPDLRVYASLDSAKVHSFFYMQEPTDYNDYDFRNAQAADLFEEVLWESTYSAYDHQEYVSSAQNTTKQGYAPKMTQQPIVYFYPRNFKLNVYVEPTLTPFFKDVSSVGLAYANSIYFNDLTVNPNLYATKNYSTFNNIFGLEGVEESTDGNKGNLLLNTKNQTPSLNVSTLYPTPISYLHNLNLYRSNFEDFSWHTDLNSNHNVNLISDLVNTDAAKLLPNLYGFDIVGNFNDLTVSEDDVSGNSRATDSLFLRHPARNSILGYNAIQKVFRSRFEEGRSHTGVLNYTESFVKKPNISAIRPNLENMLGKNKSSFYNPTLFKTTKLKNFNDLYNYNTSLNFFTFNFPFLIAEHSDPSKHFWIDWRAKWGRKEVQPAITARLSILAAPHTRRHFDFNVNDSDTLHTWDAYSLRIARARKNYLTNWAYAPYPYLKSRVWFDQSRNLQALYAGVQAGNYTYKTTVFLLNNVCQFWSSPFMYQNSTLNFTPSSSGVTSYTHTENSYTTNPISSYTVNSANLIDYLTKREFMFRQLNASKGGTVYVPKSLTASPNNPIVKLFKASYNFNDPINVGSEMLRNTSYLPTRNTLNVPTTSKSKDISKDSNRFSRATDILLDIENIFSSYIRTLDNPLTNTSNNKNPYLTKSQQRPLRKGIANMLRLHATGAIAMPTELRLQILASSRDIIHSWSIPGAGIKIDCVPGYTSHRIAIFLVGGIYWGQCMEICGRFHHWMPIVVQFMKRDLFFLWCTHFISKPNKSTGWEITDRQHVNFIRLASFDKNTWASDTL
jgi:heme/copper-type cytochrome/quinol oxidase subunit 2